MAADSSMGKHHSVNKKEVYEFIKIIRDGNQPDKAIVFYADAEYIKNLIHDIWIRNFFQVVHTSVASRSNHHRCDQMEGGGAHEQSDRMGEGSEVRNH
jgi:hypothetical protein